MNFPAACSIGFNIPFSTIAGGIASSYLGPITIIGGVILGGVIGVITEACLSGTRHPAKYNLSFNADALDVHFKSKSEQTDKKKIDATDAQAPGKPTEKDGYIPGW